VELTETGADTADFRGSIVLDTLDGNGVLLVNGGDTVTATYTDADNGQGNYSVPVTFTATVDCTGPAISGIQTTDIGPAQATVIFNTDEPANGTVRYGLSCDSLTDAATRGGYENSHSIKLTDLTASMTYFYAVDVVDEADNYSTDNNGGTCHTFTTLAGPDYFTELFVSDNDLANRSLRFDPDASYDFYSGCAESIDALPVDPGGGTPLSLSDDSSALVTLADYKTVSLYGVDYSMFYVSSNGCITFTLGDNAYTESLARHFLLPRISALFDDFNPASGGTVSWKQLIDRAVVTWENIPQYGTSDSNTFQVEMRFDGTIVISYLDIAASDGLAGLSAGGGVKPDFYESDLSAMQFCSEPTCDDGIQNQGEDRIDCGGPCLPCECLSDSYCDDGLFCNGSETCDPAGDCQTGSDPCPGQECDEAIDQCTPLGCEGDFNEDGDIDGLDLAELSNDINLLDLDVFASNFGKANCIDLGFR
jgi:hypothetical protein